METFPDLGSLSDQELKDLIGQLSEEEVGEEVITGDDVHGLTEIPAGRVAGGERSGS